MHRFVQDLRFGVRLLLRAPGFTLLASAVLALGIGALSAIFSVVDATLLRPLPYSHPGDLVMVWEQAPGNARNHVSPLNFQDWHDQNTVFSSLAAVSGAFGTLQTGDGPVQLAGQAVTSEFFSLLGIKPVAGRAFSAEDDRAGADVVLISETLWRTQFSSDAGLLGTSLTVNGKSRIVIGVVPAQFGILWRSDLWMLDTVKRTPEQRRAHYMQVLGRLKPGVSLEQARANMALVAAEIARFSPETNQGWGITVEPLRDALVGRDLRATALVLFGVVGFVLLMGCANVANLMLARGAGRTREMAVRAALGASRPRLARQLLTESLLLAGFGGAGGVALAWSAIHFAPLAFPSGTIPVGLRLALDWRVALFVLLVTVLTGALFGLGPVWQLSRTSVAGSLRAGGYSVTASNAMLLSGIAATQVAVGVVIVASALLLIRTLERLNQVDPGFHADRVLTMHVSLPMNRYPDPARALLFYDAVQKEIAALPGVRSASFGGSLPTDGWDIGQPFEVVGQPAVPEAQRHAAHYQIVGAQYFETLGIALEAGRAFDGHDTATSPQVAVVNETFARRYLKDQPPIGSRVRVSALTMTGPGMVEREIVGVINQVKIDGLGEKEAGPEIYVPITQNPWFWAALAVSTRGDPLAMLRPVKAAIAKHDAELPVTAVRTMDEVAGESIAEPRFRARLLAVFAALALLIAAAGILGVLAFSVAQRVREFGIRLALGAQVENLFALVLGRAAKIVFAGVLAGTLSAAALTRWLSALLFEVRPLDPLTFVGAPALLVLVALSAAAVPAWRASRTDPVVALRQEG